ncbi:MAG: hypothetical protein ACOY4R_27510 [Pseudomonadota bacterium]
MRLPTIKLDLNDYPEVVAAFEEASGESRAAVAEDAMDDLRDEVRELRGAIEDARRMLLRSNPSPSECLIYIERALSLAVSVAGAR